jgi:hypothetical protein
VKLKVKTDYRALRLKDYPAISEQLDAVWKGGSDLEKMREQVLAVKAKYPKPP